MFKCTNIHYLFLFLFSLAFISKSNSQCDVSEVYSNCINLVNDYNYVKTINIEPTNFKKDSSNVEFTYLFSKGTTYLITICDKNKRMLFDLFDSKRKKVVANFDLTSKKYYVAVVFPCQATGMYHLRYSFMDKQPGCGVSIVGIKK